MKIGGIDITTRPLVIAEIGANHEGDIEAAKVMIREAARTGADAVKFQTYKAAKMVAWDESERFAHFQRLSLPDSAFEELAAEATANGLLFLSTPFDVEAVEFLNALVPAFKIASGDLTFLPLLERVAEKKKPVLLSTGMASLQEIQAALETIRRAGKIERGELGGRVVLLHCVSSYPTAPEEANLLAVRRLSDEFGLPVGYSDHTLGILACIGAVALGACVIEKHFTLQKEGRTFRDHQLSADVAEMTELVASLRTLAMMFGSGEKVPAPSEEASRISMRRSLAARTDIKAGDVISAEQITCLRPGTMLPPSLLPEVIGHVALHDIPAGHLIPASAIFPERSTPDWE